MSETTIKWAFPAELQPRRATLQFNLDAALDAMVELRAEIPEQAYTAGILGTERRGYGAVVRADGLVLTIGYLITEAQTIWLTNQRGQSVPGHALAVDFASGLGLVLPLMPLATTPLTRGRAADVSVGEPLYMLGHGGLDHALATRLTARQEFAGYWEYLLDEALFTAPAHPQWGGAALLDSAGRLIGVGSLLLQQQAAGQVGDGEAHANMSVPVDLLEPIFDDLVSRGRADRPVRAWLGLFVERGDAELTVTAVASNGPAQRAGLAPGDAIEAIDGQPVQELAGLFRRVWSCGPAGTEIAVAYRRDGAKRLARVKSIDRDSILFRPRGRN